VSKRTPEKAGGEKNIGSSSIGIFICKPVCKHMCRTTPHMCVPIHVGDSIDDGSEKQRPSSPTSSAPWRTSISSTLLDAKNSTAGITNLAYNRAKTIRAAILAATDDENRRPIIPGRSRKKETIYAFIESKRGRGRERPLNEHVYYRYT
jgi:hypothetical protein